MGICECSKENQQTLRPATREEQYQALISKKEALMTEDVNPDTQDYQVQTMSQLMMNDSSAPVEDSQGESGATEQITQPSLTPIPIQMAEGGEKPAEKHILTEMSDDRTQTYQAVTTDTSTIVQPMGHDDDTMQHMVDDGESEVSGMM